MLRFITYLQITPQLKRQVKITSIIAAGLFCGYMKGRIVNQKYQNVNDSKLIQYQTQDQINMMIQKQQKPAIIYYALPMYRDHSLFRQLMFKYSNLYPNNAVWTMVNLHTKFQQAKSSFDYQYHTRIRLEVRFPKSNVAIKIGQEGDFIELPEKTNRREGFKYNFNQEGFKKFLEENRIIQGKDPLKNTLNVTKSALFNNFSQTNTTKQNKQ